MQRYLSLFILAACAGCSSQAPISAPPETRAERLAMLDQIASECQAPRTMMELVGEDRLRLKPGRDEAYEKVECVLRRVDGLNLPAGHITFVGMAAPGPPPEANGVAAREAENSVAAEAGNAQTH
ncbi:MAG TPA: hypothetical protein VLK25_02525 [Allosphingosinicella sp.]|nr:hypothetical protein [Allosphingosinicella sp.]